MHQKTIVYPNFKRQLLCVCAHKCLLYMQVNTKNKALQLWKEPRLSAVTAQHTNIITLVLQVCLFASHCPLFSHIPITTALTVTQVHCHLQHKTEVDNVIKWSVN